MKKIFVWLFLLAFVTKVYCPGTPRSTTPDSSSTATTSGRLTDPIIHNSSPAIVFDEDSSIFRMPDTDTPPASFAELVPTLISKPIFKNVATPIDENAVTRLNDLGTQFGLPELGILLQQIGCTQATQAQSGSILILQFYKDSGLPYLRIALEGDQSIQLTFPRKAEGFSNRYTTPFEFLIKKSSGELDSQKITEALAVLHKDVEIQKKSSLHRIARDLSKQTPRKDSNRVVPDLTIPSLKLSRLRTPSFDSNEGSSADVKPLERIGSLVGRQEPSQLFGRQQSGSGLQASPPPTIMPPPSQPASNAVGEEAFIQVFLQKLSPTNNQETLPRRGSLTLRPEGISSTPPSKPTDFVPHSSPNNQISQTPPPTIIPRPQQAANYWKHLSIDPKFFSDPSTFMTPEFFVHFLAKILGKKKTALLYSLNNAGVTVNYPNYDSPGRIILCNFIAYHSNQMLTLAFHPNERVLMCYLNQSKSLRLYEPSNNVVNYDVVLKIKEWIKINTELGDSKISELLTLDGFLNDLALQLEFEPSSFKSFLQQAGVSISEPKMEINKDVKIGKDQKLIHCKFTVGNQSKNVYRIINHLNIAKSVNLSLNQYSFLVSIFYTDSSIQNSKPTFLIYDGVIDKKVKNHFKDWLKNNKKIADPKYKPNSAPGKALLAVKKALIAPKKAIFKGLMMQNNPDYYRSQGNFVQQQPVSIPQSYPTSTYNAVFSGEPAYSDPAYQPYQTIIPRQASSPVLSSWQPQPLSSNFATVPQALKTRKVANKKYSVLVPSQESLKSLNMAIPYNFTQTAQHKENYFEPIFKDRVSIKRLRFKNSFEASILKVVNKSNQQEGFFFIWNNFLYRYDKVQSSWILINGNNQSIYSDPVIKALLATNGSQEKTYTAAHQYSHSGTLTRDALEANKELHRSLKTRFPHRRR